MRRYGPPLKNPCAGKGRSSGLRAKNGRGRRAKLKMSVLRENARNSPRFKREI